MNILSSNFDILNAITTNLSAISDQHYLKGINPVCSGTLTINGNQIFKQNKELLSSFYINSSGVAVQDIISGAQLTGCMFTITSSSIILGNLEQNISTTELANGVTYLDGTSVQNRYFVNIGMKNICNAWNSVVIGTKNTIATSAHLSLVHGYKNKANAWVSHAEGSDTQTFGDSAHSEGWYTFAYGKAAHSEGFYTEASGLASHAEGDYSITSGTYSHAEGDHSKSYGIASHAEGFNAISNGDYSHAEGRDTYANGMAAHAEGRQTTATGQYAHAEGLRTKSYGNYTHAEGTDTIVSGIYSHVEGYATIANGGYSHAEGEGATANFNGAHAEGYHTQTAENYQHVEGKWNIPSAGFQKIVGGGTSASRKNIYTLDWSGNGEFAGNVNANNLYCIDNNLTVLTEQLNNLVNNLSGAIAI